jgi:hypothetical protein
MLIAVVIGVILQASLAFAQQTTLIADIPFDFVVKNTTMPAGQYTISGMNNKVLLISSRDWHHRMYVTTDGVDSAKLPTDNKLVFNRYGDEYFLEQIWVAGVAQGDRLPLSSRERELAGNGAPVTVLAKR